MDLKGESPIMKLYYDTRDSYRKVMNALPRRLGSKRVVFRYSAGLTL